MWPRRLRGREADDVARVVVVAAPAEDRATVATAPAKRPSRSWAAHY
jgi:hypothetical protein